MAEDKHIPSEFDMLFNRVNHIIEEAQNTVYRTANFTMVQAYGTLAEQ